MSPRLKLRAAATPLVMAGALWASGALSPFALGGGAQTPPPCGPDGVCVPRPETFGVYQTRWRTFPGDVIVKTPTAADEAEAEDETGLGGPQLPDAEEEGQLGPTRAPRGAGAPGEEPAAEGEEDAAAAGLGAFPGEAPLPGGFELPGAAQPAPGGEGAETPGGGPDAGPQPGPGGEPGADPLDPFGSAPPAPPAWLRNAALQNPLPAAVSTLPVLPAVEPAVAAIVQPPVSYLPAERAEFIVPAVPPAAAMDGPNLHGDDAPPRLPPELLGGIGAAPAVPNPTLRQPDSAPAAESVFFETIEDSRVVAASDQQPVGIQLVNPAAAIVDPSAQGPQQAIYFEVSDQ